jgi:plasmid stability protein
MKTKFIVIALPEDLHTLVKVRAAETKQTLKAFVIDALEKTVERGRATRIEEGVDLGMSKQRRARKTPREK